MSVRELLHLRKSVPVTRGSNPIVTFQDEMNKLFQDFFGEMTLPRWSRSLESSFAINPAIDAAETAKEYKITADLPGMDAKDVQITANDGYVTIRGEKREETEEETQGYFRQERAYGTFQRVVALPDAANLDKAEASFKNGVLTLSIPKSESAKSTEHMIEIKQVA